MAGNGPNGKNRRDGIDQGEKQAAVEGGRRPQRRRCPQPEGARKKRPVRHAHIAEKALDPIEESGQPFRIEPRREIAPGEARAQLVVVLPLDRAFWLRPLRQNAEIIFIDDGSGENAKTSYPVERRLRWAYWQDFSQASDDGPKWRVEHLVGFTPGQLIGHVRPRRPHRPSQFWQRRRE
jgi:hypothetical protein